ncbi:unnamed protein product [Discosporangium mesarthrocarpum]
MGTGEGSRENTQTQRDKTDQSDHTDEAAQGRGQGHQGQGKEGFPKVLDCFLMDRATIGMSDHCPVGLVLTL